MSQAHSAKYVHDLQATDIETARVLAQKRKEEDAKRRKFESFDNLTGSEDFLQWMATRGLILVEKAPDLPTAYESEMSAIGAMMMESEAARIVLTRLTANTFTWKRNQIIFKSARVMYQRIVQRVGEEIDMVSLGAQLRRDRVLEEVGGSSYLSECIEACPSSANVAAYIREIQEVSRLRFSYYLASTITSSVLAPGAQPGQILNAIRNSLDGIERDGYADLKAIFESAK